MAKLNVMVGGFIKYQPLLQQLVSREIKVKYKRSVLGILWTLLNPLLNMAVITMVFSNVFRMGIENYPVYYLTGSIIFTFNSEATTQSLTSILGNGGLIKKVYIPKYLFPLAKVLASLVNFFFSFLALLIVMLVTGSVIYPTIILTVLLLPPLLFFVVGLSLILSSAAVFFRDVIHLYGVFVSLWNFLTPIFYPIEALPENIQFVIRCNPLYYFVVYFRKICMQGIFPSWGDYLVCFLIGSIALLLGVIVFYRKQNKFLLYM